MFSCLFLLLLEYDVITGRFFCSDDYYNSEGCFFVCVCGFVSSVKAGKSHNFDALENPTTVMCLKGILENFRLFIP